MFGPKAFIFYINDIFKLKLRGKIQLYADDTTIVYAEPSLSELKIAMESDLITIRDFFHSLLLDLNASKTKYILFYGRKRFESFVDRNLNLKLGNEAVERVESYKCLGLWIDERLNFHDHIDRVYNKCVSFMYALKRVRECLTQKLAYQLYFAHIYSHLIFLNPLWSIASESYMNRLFTLQKKCLKIIQNKDIRASSVSLFSNKILPLPVINDYNLLILAFKIRNNLIKNNVVLRFVNEIHSQGTRSSLGGHFYVVPYETSYGKADFYRRGLIRFNELPSDLKNIRTLPLFKRRIREHLYEDYFGL